MKSNSQAFRRRWARIGVLCVLAVGVTGAAAGVAAGSGGSKKAVKIAYLSFAVANSYDAPMLAAAQKAAAAGTRASRCSTPTTTRRRSSTSSRRHQLERYNAIIIQPIESTNLITLVRRPSGSTSMSSTSTRSSARTSAPTAPGPGSLRQRHVRPDRARPQVGMLVVQACAAHHLNPATSATCTTSRRRRWTRPFTAGS